MNNKQIILETIKTHNGLIGNKEIEEITGINIRTCQRNICALKNDKLIYKKGRYFYLYEEESK